MFKFIKDRISEIQVVPEEVITSKWEWIDGWKVVRPDMRAMTNDFQFERGGAFTIENSDEIQMGRVGFHFFEHSHNIINMYSPGNRVFKIKACVPVDRKPYSYGKQVAAAIIFEEEVDYVEYQKIFYQLGFNNEEDYQAFLNRPEGMTAKEYFISGHIKKLHAATGLSEAFCTIIVDELERKAPSDTYFGAKERFLKRRVDNAITFYNEPSLSKEMAIYLMLKE